MELYSFAKFVNVFISDDEHLSSKRHLLWEHKSPAVEGLLWFFGSIYEFMKCFWS